MLPLPKTTLKQHTKSVHDGKKPFKCDVSFGNKPYLKMHIASVHEGIRTFKCEICSVSFSQNTMYEKGNFDLVFGRGEILLTYMIFVYHWNS